MGKNYAGGFGVLLAVLALAQRLGNYENKPLAIVLAAGVVLSFTVLVVIWIREKVREHKADSGTEIKQETHGPQSPALIAPAGPVTISYGHQITHGAQAAIGPALAIETSRGHKRSLMIVNNSDDPAYNVEMTPIESDRYVLMSEKIEKVEGRDRIFLRLHSILNTDRENPIFPAVDNADPFLLDKSDGLEARFDVELVYTGSRTTEKYAAKASVACHKSIEAWEYTITEFRGVSRI